MIGSKYLRCSFEEILGLMLQNVPPDDQKIKTLVSSSLYAYELPESLSSGSMSGGEEERLSLCSLRSQREAQTFTAIQRSVQPKQQLAGELSCGGMWLWWQRLLLGVLLLRDAIPCCWMSGCHCLKAL